MNAAQRKLPGALGGSASETQITMLKQAYTSTIENEKGILLTGVRSMNGHHTATLAQA